ncbi:hypothetical protein BN946_scf184335.g3 [Trametes cinnabarina]|uniref:Uncharacterized protein n=1 Tax=Pycnoporus cinnabarinus TaxID=5643 RepID=A0A060SLJ8_PYCCI|nr:hypothetical protein BN946_scf184335.g3 [Trametes cinnabarina]
MALGTAIGFAYLKRYHTIHIFADSESALQSVLDTSTGRMSSVNACRILRDWFERDPRNHLHLHYCPSHSGVAENEAVDVNVRYRVFRGGRVRRPGEVFPTSYSYMRSAITSEVLDEWKQLVNANPSAYWGRFHFRHPTFRQLMHTGHYPLKRLSAGPDLTARFIRCITGHAPTGHYRDRFRLRHHESTFCYLHSGRPTYHTREHVLFECDRYTRLFRHSSIEEFLQSLDPFYDIERFLRDNPTALSFADAPPDRL